jgi:hypothetical protein
MRIEYTASLLLLIILLSSCKENEKKESLSKDDILVQEGFILQTEIDELGTGEWYFVFAKKIDERSWLRNFRTENLRDGFEFFPLGHTNFPVAFIQKHMDTLYLPNTTGERFYRSQLRLFPIKIKYKLKPEFRNKPARSKFIQDIGKRQVQFNFNSLPIDIQDLVPLAKPKWEIKECQCEPKQGDVNEYLFKICNYLKGRESKYSDVPCSYRVRKIETDTLNGSEVVRVDLNCCYLGDVAYFDPKTKELLEFRNGAM